MRIVETMQKTDWPAIISELPVLPFSSPRGCAPQIRKTALSAAYSIRTLRQRGANAVRGNSNNPTLAFRMLRTGDIGYQDWDGYFYILDRLKDMIVTGGKNVYSGEVEAVVYKHPAIREVAVFGIPDSKWGELVMAYVLLKPGIARSANDLSTHCRQFLPNYKIPRRFEFSDTALPKSGCGKILKRILRERFMGSRRAGRG